MTNAKRQEGPIRRSITATRRGRTSGHGAVSAGRRTVAIVSILIVVFAAAAAAHVLLAPPRPESGGTRLTGADFNIAPYMSQEDADHDGTDDQTDILQSAKAYVATGPTYGSSYYDGGWPDDGRGVCTDVVAYALLGAGYDLQALVDEDIRRAPEAYDVETPDPNIDYRRVRNLRVWFDRNATSLTCDPTQTDQWQGGDIVCYANHIGVVSDRRNADGVPYVIHHWGKAQLAFEEDRLASYGEIIGHWRVS